MANMVTITEERFFELYRKATETVDDGRLAVADRCIDDIQKELSKAEAGDSIGNVKAARKIISAYRKAKEAK